MKGIFNKILTVTLSLSLVVGLMYGFTVVKGADETEVTLGYWLFSRAGVAYNNEYANGNEGRIKSVTMDDTNEVITGWRTKDPEVQEQTATEISSGFKMSISCVGWDRNYNTGEINPYSVQAKLIDTPMEPGHDYTVSFKAHSSAASSSPIKKKYAYISFNSEVNGLSMPPYSYNGTCEGDRVIALEAEEDTFTYKFTNWVSAENFTTTIMLGAFCGTKDYSGNDITDIVTEYDNKFVGDVYINDFTVVDCGLNPDFVPPTTKKVEDTTSEEDETLESFKQNTQEGAVPLLSGKIYDYSTNYAKGVIDTYYKRYSDTYEPTPLRLTWDKFEGATNYAISIGMNADLSDAKTYETKQTYIDIEDLYAGYDYYYKVEATVDGQTQSTDVFQITTMNLPRTVAIDGVHNTRDMGGCYTRDGNRLKQGIIYRGARLDDITKAGINKMVNTYGIKTVIDLREPEYAPEESLLGGDTNLINVSGVQYMTVDPDGDYCGIDVSYGWKVLKQELLPFTDSNNYPIYFHCNIGRDRTGTLAFLLEALAGMSQADIYRDYELTFFDGFANSEVAKPSNYTKSNFNDMYNYIKNYSSGNLQENTEKFLKERVKLTQEQIYQIKSNILEQPVEYIPETTTEKQETTKKQETTTEKQETTSEETTEEIETTTQESKEVTTCELPTIAPTTKAETVNKNVVSIKKITAKKRALKVSWKKVNNIKGYQIEYSRKKNFRISTLITIKNAKTTSKTIKKLDAKKSYFVRMRTYMLSNGKKLYSKWSAVKSKKTK